MAKAQTAIKPEAPTEKAGETAAEQAPATAGADIVAEGSAAAANTPAAPVEKRELCDVRVLAAVTIGEERYQPDEVIEGLPVSVAEAYKGSVDAHPDAVAYARSLGGPIKQFAE